jgi:hypothetical protein
LNKSSNTRKRTINSDGTEIETYITAREIAHHFGLNIETVLDELCASNFVFGALVADQPIRAMLRNEPDEQRCWIGTRVRASAGCNRHSDILDIASEGLTRVCRPIEIKPLSFWQQDLNP